jgi:sugar lactone lactonase YvrE
MKGVKRIVVGVAVFVIVVAGIAVVVAVTSPVDPLAYSPPEPPELRGAFEPNVLLRDAELMGGDLAGPEDVAVDDRGRVYCGLEDGTIRRFDPASGTGRFEIFATADGGRPLGLDFGVDDLLWVADTKLGLLSVDSTGEVRIRSNEAAGVRVGFADDVAVAADGNVYFSDATTRFGHREILFDVLEARPHGRLLVYDPATDRTRVALDGLYFANGVAVAPGDEYVLVVETFRYRIRRLWLRGPGAGDDEILVDNLPGFPDGVASDGHGTFWVALYGLRNPALDRFVHPRPWLKRLVARLPKSMQGGTKPYGLILAIDGDGKVLRSLHDPGGQTISHITSVEPVDGALYLGTVERTRIGRVFDRAGPREVESGP